MHTTECQNSKYTGMHGWCPTHPRNLGWYVCHAGQDMQVDLCVSWCSISIPSYTALYRHRQHDTRPDLLKHFLQSVSWYLISIVGAVYMCALYHTTTCKGAFCSAWPVSPSVTTNQWLQKFDGFEHQLSCKVNTLAIQSKGQGWYLRLLAWSDSEVTWAGRYINRPGMRSAHDHNR